MNKLILSFLLLAFINIQAQNKSSYFKTIPQLNDSTPRWATMMYSANPNVDEVVDAYQAYYASHKFVKNIHTQNYKHWLMNIGELVNAQGYITDPDSKEYRERIAKLKKQYDQAQNYKSSTWTNIGPYKTYKNDGSLSYMNNQANVYAIGVAPSNHNIVYALTEAGGLFKTLNKGLYWYPVSLGESFTNGQDVKVDPQNPNIVYVATSKKIYKSSNGGNSWSLVYNGSGTIEQMLIHPVQSSKIFAATANGLIYSSNGGQSWTTKLNYRCWDIEANPLNPNTLYLSVHNASLKKAQIYKSTNWGNSWTLLDSNWYTPANLSQASDIGCKIGVTPADTNRIYACLIGNSKAGDNGWIGVYYSANGGQSWVNPDSIDGGPYATGMNKNTNWYVAGYSNGYHQGWYNFDMDVSASNPDRIWIGTIWACESDNKGKNIEYIRGTRNLPMHADVQDIDVVGSDIWYVSDGGINYSNNEMQTTEVRNQGLHASEFWGFGQGWNEDTWTGGRYHNGDAVYHENFGSGQSIFLGGAEKSTGYINPMNNRHCYFSDISDKMTPDSLTQTAQSVSSISLYPNESYWALNSSEIEFDPNYANTLYLGKDNKLYKSTDGGATFSVLHSFTSSGRVLEFEISKFTSDTVYALVRINNVGNIYRSTDGGNSFSAIAAIPASNRSKLDLTLNPSDANNLWVSSYYGSNGQKVYETTNGGQSWTNRTTSALNGHRILDILYQAGSNDVVYVATDHGLFYWDAGASNWISYNNGLPFITKGLKLIPFYRDHKLRFGTSRGIWEVDLAKPSTIMPQPMTYNKNIYCSRDTVYFEDHSVTKHAGVSWHWSFSPAPLWINSSNIRNPKALFANGSYTVSLSITDSASGNTYTKSVNNMIVVNSECEPDSVAGMAMQLSGANDWASVPDLNIQNCTHFTVTAWIKIKGIQPAYSCIIMNNNDAAGFNFRNNNELGYHWPGGQWWWNSGLSVDTNEWAYVAMVATPDSMTLYLNGIPSVHHIQLNPVDINSMHIGNYMGWSSRTMKGEIDEVCIWKRALSQNEIRELRHLTKESISPYFNDLVAYYQFNKQGISQIIDRAGNFHAMLSGNANKVNSDVPVAKGVSERKTIANAAYYNFGNTGVAMHTGNTGPQGEVVVSHLNANPNVMPASSINEGEYWIINHYGSGNFSALDSIFFSSFETSPILNTADIKLYERPENAYQNNWSQKCVAKTINNGAFVFDNSCNITNFGQFWIPFTKSTAIENPEASSFEVYPNPARNRFTIERKGDLNAEITLELYDVSGRFLMQKQLTAGSNKVYFDISNLSKGVYMLKILNGENSLVKMVTKE